MTNKRFSIVFLFFCSYTFLLAGNVREDFRNPPMKFRPQVFYFWNDSVAVDSMLSQMQNLTLKSGYGGFGILGYGKYLRPAYDSENYYRVYGRALSRSKKLGTAISLYDENGFPTGSSAGVSLFKNAFPDKTQKRLDKTDEIVHGPGVIYRRIPQGKLMAVVGMDTVSHVRYDLMSGVYANRLKWHVPSGTFRLMFFYLTQDSDSIVDYLDPVAAKDYIGMFHQEYFNRFRQYFGKVITKSFLNGPATYGTSGRMWTEAFNDRFREKFGFRPEKMYPALWYDIGPETQAARNYIFGFRSELYAKGYIKEVNDWSASHDILATGHQDQEEVLNPVGISGDLMKCFKYLAIPGIDKIGGNRPAERFYKLVSSAAENWDKPYVMSETFGAMGNISWKTMYSVAMEQYAKGINMLMPQAVWYNDKKIAFRPELSYRNPVYADSLPVFNRYLSRLNVMLQAPGKHIADLAVLYPIQTLQGEYNFAKASKSTYSIEKVPGTDYADVSNWLTDSVGRDFTFIHPEILDEKCVVRDSSLLLSNKMNPEKFQVLVVPGAKTISPSNLEKIRFFYKKGGKILFTTALPYKSTVIGGDSVIAKIMFSIFPEIRMSENGELYSDTDMYANDRSGGRCFYLKAPDAAGLKKTIDKLMPAGDVSFGSEIPMPYIHKVRNCINVYFFANKYDKQFDSEIALRGKLKLKLWNPYDGTVSKVQQHHESVSGVDYTVARLKLDPVSSAFLVGGQSCIMNLNFKEMFNRYKSISSWKLPNQ